MLGMPRWTEVFCWRGVSVRNFWHLDGIFGDFRCCADATMEELVSQHDQTDEV
jgi:hypothetical protein